MKISENPSKIPDQLIEIWEILLIKECMSFYTKSRFLSLDPIVSGCESHDNYKCLI